MAACDPVFWWTGRTAQQCAAGTLDSYERFPFPWVVLAHILGREGISFPSSGQKGFWKISSLISHCYGLVLLLSKPSSPSLGVWSWCFSYLGWFVYPSAGELENQCWFSSHLCGPLLSEAKELGFSLRIKSSSQCFVICLVWSKSLHFADLKCLGSCQKKVLYLHVIIFLFSFLIIDCCGFVLLLLFCKYQYESISASSCCKRIVCIMRYKRCPIASI